MRKMDCGRSEQHTSGVAFTYIDSPEPADASVATALDFVGNYVKLNTAADECDTGNSTGGKENPVGERGVFDWDNNGEDEGGELFRKNKEAFTILGVSRGKKQPLPIDPLCLSNKPKVEGKEKGNMRSSGRKTLSDITNVRHRFSAMNQDNKPRPSSDAIEQLQKENSALMKLLADKNRSMELNGAEEHKLRVTLQKVQQQNLQLARSNSQMLAELNSVKERQKALKHELGCKDGLIIHYCKQVGARETTEIRFDTQMDAEATEDLRFGSLGTGHDSTKADEGCNHLPKGFYKGEAQEKSLTLRSDARKDKRKAIAIDVQKVDFEYNKKRATFRSKYKKTGLLNFPLADAMEIVSVSKRSTFEKTWHNQNKELMEVLKGRTALMHEIIQAIESPPSPPIQD